jgi:hypothetical protein
MLRADSGCEYAGMQYRVPRPVTDQNIMLLRYGLAHSRATGFLAACGRSGSVGRCDCTNHATSLSSTRDDIAGYPAMNYCSYPMSPRKLSTRAG